MFNVELSFSIVMLTKRKYDEHKGGRQKLLQSWSDKSQRFFFLDKIIDNSFAMFFWKKRIRNIVVTSKQIQSY